MKKFPVLVLFLVAFAAVVFNPAPTMAQTSPIVEFLINEVKLPAQPPPGKRNFVAAATDTIAVKATGATAQNLTCTVNSAPVNCSSIKLDAVGVRATVEARLAMNRDAAIPHSRTFDVAGGKEPKPLPVVVAAIEDTNAMAARFKAVGEFAEAKKLEALAEDLRKNRTNVLKIRQDLTKLEPRLEALEKKVKDLKEEQERLDAVQKQQATDVVAAATTANQAFAVANDAANAAANAQSTADGAQSTANQALDGDKNTNARIDLPSYSPRLFAEATVRGGLPSWGPRLLLGVGFPLGDKGTRGELSLGYTGDFVSGGYSSGATGGLGFSQALTRESGVDLYLGGFGGVVVAEETFGQVGGRAGLRWWFPGQGHAALVVGGFAGGNIGPVEQKVFGGGEAGILVLLGDRRP